MYDCVYRDSWLATCTLHCQGRASDGQSFDLPRALQPGVSRIRMGQPSQLVVGGVSARLSQSRGNVGVYLVRVMDHNSNTNVVVKLQ